MEERMILEVLDRAGRVKERVRLDGAPVTIGRAYSCDVIVDDAYVSAQHVRVARAADGHWTVDDLQSLNGLYQLLPPARVMHAVIEPECQLRIGETVLRFRDTSHPVAPAVPQVEGTVLRGRIVGTWWGAVGILLGAAGLMVVDAYLGLYQRPSARRLLGGLVPAVFLLLVWSGVWAVVSRAVSHRFHFLEHCSIAALGGVAVTLFYQSAEYYAFATAAGTSVRVLRWVGAAAILAVLFYRHGRLCSVESRRGIAMRAGGAAVVLVGLVLLGTSVSRSDFSPLPDYPHEFKPPAFRLAHGRRIDEFFAQLPELKTSVDALLRESHDVAKPER